MIKQSPQYLSLSALAGFLLAAATSVGAQPITSVVPAQLGTPMLNAPTTSIETPAYEDGRRKFVSGELRDAEIIWLQIATDAGNSDAAQARYGLASIYEFGGSGVEEQPLLAAQLYGLACEQGIPDACTNLGVMYSVGRGVEQDEETAAALWDAASARGHCLADFNLGLAFYSGKGVELDRDQAVERIFNASQCQVPEADYAVCQFYRLGLGLPKNDGLALSYCQRASANGNAAAKAVVGELVVAGVEATDIESVDRQGQPKEPITERESSTDGDGNGGNVGNQTRPDLSANQDSMMFGSGSSQGNNQSTAQGTQGVNCASIMVHCDDSSAPQSIAPTASSPQPQPRVQFDFPLEGEELDFEDLPVFPNYRPRGVPPRDPILVLWFGSAESETEAQQYWSSIEELVAKVLDDPAPTFLTHIVPAELAFTGESTALTRIYLGPIPSANIGWQVCNVLRLEKPSTFCKPWDANSI